MSETKLPQWVKSCLWAIAGGRCQYEGCNRPLYLDVLTQKKVNSSYFAHVVADKVDGPRGDAVLSPQLVKELSNVMLLCDTHHRLIDHEDIAGHSVERLQLMKRRHEERIDRLTSLQEDKQSHILLYGARIGQHDSPLAFDKAANAMLPMRYPAQSIAFEIGLKASAFTDDESQYWTMEQEQLRRQFGSLIKPQLAAGNIGHLSVFALGPIPLLVELGRLLSDIPEAQVFQLHREPVDWKWRDVPTSFEYEISEGTASNSKQVALVLGLSADISDERIKVAVGSDASIWRIRHAMPGNDFLQSEVQLSEFRKHMRQLFNRIKLVHGEETELHVFPAVPVAIAVELGRVWMPKADLPLRIYDQNRLNGGFNFALVIK